MTRESYVQNVHNDLMKLHVTFIGNNTAHVSRAGEQIAWNILYAGYVVRAR